MQKFLSKQFLYFGWIALVLSTPAIILYLHFTKIFKCPACYLFMDGGDGLKNYYTLLYYVQHDSGWHFSGMNYPYGEHIIYTDNQPALALGLQWIDWHLFDMGPHVVGTLNMLLLLSIYAAVLVAYKLLRRWGVGRWWALASSLCIIFLSPQLLRLHGHYGLAYVFFLPLLFLLPDYLVRDTRRRWLWSILACLFVILISLIHMYFLLISVVTIFAFTFFWWWYHRAEHEYVRKVILWLGAIIIVPAIFLVGLRSATDDIKDRPVEPWGIDAHNITFESTFFPFIPPLDKAWTVILGKEKPIGEKIAYTGLVGLLMLPGVLYFLLRRRDEDFMNTHVKTFLCVGIVSWLMGAGVLYQNGFKFLWELIPLLKQFRGLGRFGFSFYYAYMLVCSYLLWRTYLKLREKDLVRIGQYLLCAVFLVWAFESWLHLKSIRDPVFNENKLLSLKGDDYLPLLTSAGYKPADFQAILQLPIVIIGNETMGVTRGHWTLREGMHASIETGLPLIGYAMSRTSVSQGLDMVELISTPYFEKRRARHFDQRPILLLCEEEFVIPAERKWIDKAKKIGMYKSITLYSIPATEFTQTDEKVLINSADATQCNGWFNGFEDMQSDTPMTGKGALVIREESVSIWSYVDTSSVPRDWQISFWSHVDNRKGNVPVPRLMETDPNGVVIQNSGLHRDDIAWAEANGKWIQVSLPLKTQGKGYRYELFIEQPGPVIDNLSIQEDTCVINSAGTILFNNLPVYTTQ